MFQLDKQTANAAQGKDAVRLKKLQGCAGHGRYMGFVRVLDNGQAARLLDLAQPQRTIAIGTCEQYRGQALLIHVGRRLKKVINRRSRKCTLSSWLREKL